jgi:hypothetical protein
MDLDFRTATKPREQVSIAKRSLVVDPLRPLSMQWNDAGDSNNFTFSDENKASSHIMKKISQNSKNLFGQDGVYNENQEVKITIPDKAPDGSTLLSPVEVRCTMLIVGLAPYMGDLE